MKWFRRWIDKMALHARPRYMTEAMAELDEIVEMKLQRRAETHLKQITKQVAVLIHSNVITDRELGMAVGKLQDKDPELALRLNELRHVIRRMADDT